jgi:hypothetical protein
LAPPPTSQHGPAVMLLPRGEAEALVPFLLTAALYPARELDRVSHHAPSA